MNTLYLDPVDWDLTVDSDGNIAVAREPYALAQDAASAIRTFLGEVWYDKQLGVPYFQQVLGVTPVPSIQYLKSLLVRAALTVPDVIAAQVFIQDFIYDLRSGEQTRRVTGQVQISNKTGVISAARF